MKTIEQIMELVDNYTDAFHTAMREDGGIGFAGGLVAKIKKDLIRKALRESNPEQLVVTEAYAELGCVDLSKLENRTALITRAKAAHEPKDKNEKLYVWESVQTCWGTDLCLLDMPRDNAVYLVRGSEMYRFVLPELPPPDPTMGTGAKSIDRMLPDKE